MYGANTISLFLILWKYILTNVIEGTKDIQSYFHPFRCYFITFICMTHDKNENTFFFCILYHAFAHM